MRTGAGWLCIALAVIAWLAPTDHLQRREARVRMARDMLAGSALTVVIVPQLLVR